MKTFSEWLFEKQFKHLKVKARYSQGNIVEVNIYINPNPKELQKTVNSRGLIDKKGNLYLFEENDYFIHSDIIEILKPILKLKVDNYNFNITEFQDMEFVPVQRYKNNIGVSESMRDYTYLNDSGDYGLRLFKKAEKKNPKLNFTFMPMSALR